MCAPATGTTAKARPGTTTRLEHTAPANHRSLDGALAVRSAFLFDATNTQTRRFWRFLSRINVDEVGAPTIGICACVVYRVYRFTRSR